VVRPLKGKIKQISSDKNGLYGGRGEKGEIVAVNKGNLGAMCLHSSSGRKGVENRKKWGMLYLGKVSGIRSRNWGKERERGKRTW